MVNTEIPYKFIFDIFDFSWLHAGRFPHLASRRKATIRFMVWF